MDILEEQKKAEAVVGKYLANNDQVELYNANIVENDLDGLKYLKLKVVCYLPVTPEDKAKRDAAFEATKQAAMDLGWKDSGSDQKIDEADPEYGCVVEYVIDVHNL